MVASACVVDKGDGAMANQRFDIVKSRSDKREYRGLILPNRMKVMLVSDPTTDKSAASMDVHVGSMSDPWDIPGLAHFLEHMLFLGTEKYPDENEYSKYLANHNGTYNAYTADNNTNYYFDVAPEHLKGALDRFGQFFISPLLTEDATDREMKAVDSENSNNFKHDGWKLRLLEKAWGKSGHDWGKFCCGNLETLKTVPEEKGLNVRDHLLKFHDKWYSPNIMSLAVLGKEPLDDLEENVTSLFAGIPDKNVSSPEWDEHAYPAGTGLQTMKVVPVKDLRYLTMLFPIPSFKAHYKTNPGGYFSHLLGHEGKGSLLSELKKREWCSYLSAGEELSVENFGFFKVSTDLTVAGMDHVDDIVEMVFQYLDLLRRTKAQKWIFDENAALRNTQFEFKDKENPQGYVTSLSSELHDTPMNDLLKVLHYAAQEEYKPELIDSILEHLVPENVRVQVTAQAFESVATDEEQWYKTKHIISPVTDESATRWKSAKAEDQPSLHLPEPNPFVPTDFELCTRDKLSEEKNHPLVLRDTPLSRLWYKQDTEYLLPKAYLKVRVTSPLPYKDPRHFNCNTLFQRLFYDFINEELYPACIAGMGYGMSSWRHGVTFTVSGYHHKQEELLTRIFALLADFKVDENRYEIFKENYSRELSNHASNQPYNHATYFNTVALSSCQWTQEELAESLKSVAASDVQDYIGRMFESVFVESLMCGNLTPQKALSLTDKVEGILQDKFGSRGMTAEEREMVSLRDREYIVPEKSDWSHKFVNQVHASSCIETYYQVGSHESIHTDVVVDLFAKMIKEPAMDQLRTKETLGYIVWSGVRCVRGDVQGIRVLVQGSREPAYLNERIEAFLKQFRQEIVDMPQAEFEAVRQALVDQKLEQPKKLSARVDRYWSEILCERFNFDRRNLEAEELRTVTREEVLAFYDKHICRDSAHRRKVSCFVVPVDESKMTPTADGELTLEQPKKVDNIEDMKAGLELHPALTKFKQPSEFSRSTEGSQ